jgi:hypothetical protein
LLAVTNALCQDVAAIPFLWVLPLSLYLLSFMLCFKRRPWHNPWWSIAALVVGIGALCLHWYQLLRLHLMLQVAAYSVALLAGCVLCHGVLARLQPEPRRLTSYYLMIALGGALGGGFVALAAPVLFTAYLELPLGLCLGLLVALAMILADWRKAERQGRAKRRRVFLLLAVSVLLLATPAPFFNSRGKTIESSRTFFGVVRVVRVGQGGPEERNLMIHNGTKHGQQFADPARRQQPTSYYGEPSGAGQILRLTETWERRRVGLIGLGVGTLAAYGKSTDYLCFYEMNPEVERLARKHFSFLNDSAARCEIVPGDARLALERQSPCGYDVLVLDAFSGDAIPVHLLTREAFLLYQRHLKPDGIIAVHITNQHLDLQPVAERQGLELGCHVSRVKSLAVPERGIDACHWILLTRNNRFIQQWNTAFPTARFEPGTALPSLNEQHPLWTDDRHNLLRCLRGWRW